MKGPHRGIDYPNGVDDLGNPFTTRGLDANTGLVVLFRTMQAAVETRRTHDAIRLALDASDT
ncbi:hypothetical protein DF047_11630 [Burkholderia cenocepacia]|uniref:hypothetical protein n=1 Tax=Burkholderia cenocepacia TaxID=95486 RepID=UPI000F5BED36|nr:hypothetical protein [Burkholderia cenocepacia]RQV09229.1 hypothetical protein DF047_11630 [Burkholderia cenocepacia]